MKLNPSSLEALAFHGYSLFCVAKSRIRFYYYTALYRMYCARRTCINRCFAASGRNNLFAPILEIICRYFINPALLADLPELGFCLCRYCGARRWTRTENVMNNKNLNKNVLKRNRNTLYISYNEILKTSTNVVL